MENLIPVSWRNSLEQFWKERMPRRWPSPESLSRMFAGSGPVIDMDVDENEIRITAEIPGVDQQDLKVELAGRQVIIRGEKKSCQESHKGDAYYSECNYGSFSRTLDLPSEIDPNRIEANFRNGVLRMRLPKAENAKSHKIEIQV
jgi:HSP20 family protein